MDTVVEILKIAIVPVSMGIIAKITDIRNEKAHQALGGEVGEIRSDVNKVISHFELNVENGEMISKMDEVKAHYVARFNDKKFKVAADEKSNIFISLIAKTIKEHPKMSISSWLQVSQDFDTGFEEVLIMMKSHVGDHANAFFSTHTIDYLNYKERLEAVFMDVENRKKERFIKISNEFMIKYLTSLISYEKDQS